MIYIFVSNFCLSEDNAKYRPQEPNWAAR